MQSSEVSKLIKTYYGLFNDQKWEEFIDMVDENVVHEINHGSSEKGKSKFRAFMKVMDEHYTEQVENLVVFVGESPDRAAAEFNIRGKYLKSQDGLPLAKGQPYFIRVGAFFEIKNNKVTRITNYYNLTDWIAQVSK